MTTFRIGDLVTSLERKDWIGEVVATSELAPTVVVQWRSASGVALEAEYENEHRLVLVECRS